jgi:hypothetical protein
MSKSLLLIVGLAISAQAYAEESALERAARKTGAFVERTADKVSPGLDRAGKAIERGAKAAGRGAERGATAVQKGAGKVHRKVDEKVRPKP